MVTIVHLVVYFLVYRGVVVAQLSVDLAHFPLLYLVSWADQSSKQEVFSSSWAVSAAGLGFLL